MLINPNGRLFLGTSSGMVFEFVQDQVGEIYLDKQSNTTRINDLALDQDGHLWVATDGNGLFKINTLDKRVSHYTKNAPLGKSINNNIVLSLYSDNERVWIGTDGGGLNLFDKTFQEFHYYTQNYYNPQIISDNSILAIEKGHNNNILLATVHGGLSIVKNSFVVKNVPAQKVGFSNKNQQGSTILEDSFGHIWLSAGRSGLVRYSPKDQSTSFYTDQPNSEEDLSGSIVMSLLEDNKKRLWIATLRGGVSVLDIKTNKFIPLKGGNKLSGASALELDQHGNIWIGHRTGITVLDPEFNIIHRLLPNEHRMSSSNLVTAIIKDVKNDMWVGTTNGLFRYQKHGDSYEKQSFFHRKGDSTSLSGNHIRSLGQSSDLSILVGTYGYGLNKYNRSTSTFEKYHGHINIKGNTIEGILKDHLDNIWVSTNMGLTKIDTQGNITNFSEHDGIHSFNGGGAHLGKNGGIYTAGPYGLSFFSPAELQPTTLESKINFTSLNAKNDQTETLLNSIELSRYKNSPDRTIVLQPQTTFLKVAYTSSDPITSQESKYAYTIEEQEDSWTQVGELQTLTFTNLNPGQYTLKVRAMDQNGYPSKYSASLQIKVLPTLWQTLWFRIAVFLMIILIISLLYRSLRSVHKNDLLNTIKEKLKNELRQKEISKKSISTLIDHINDSFMFDKEWDHFYSLFNEIHPAFISNLKENHPNLSERDFKLCALILMKFTSKDIATLFGISVSSVKIARHRLKKKLHLESNEKVLDRLLEISKVTTT